jgi:dTDP-4-dehydrorhamnose 3,5-epimerase
MGAVSLDDIRVTPLKRIPTPGGDVMHAMKRSDAGYVAFGEAYFSWVEAGAVKAWKRHRRMTLNLVVPVGRVRFAFTLGPHSRMHEAELGERHYARITLPPGIWFGFQGVDRSSLVLNLADIEHDPTEVERLPYDTEGFDWSPS